MVVKRIWWGLLELWYAVVGLGEVILGAFLNWLEDNS